MKAGEVDIHVIDPGALASSSGILTDQEIARATRFKFEKDRIHWAACRRALKTILAANVGISARDLRLIEGDGSKPRLPAPWGDLHFNLSHCAGRAVVAISREAPVGVDIEADDRGHDLAGCETSFCHPLEIANLPLDDNLRHTELLRIWTAKEAVLKALGTGLRTSPQEVRIDFSQHPPRAFGDRSIEGLEIQRLYPLDHPSLAGYRAFLSTALSAPKVGYRF